MAIMPHVCPSLRRKIIMPKDVLDLGAAGNAARKEDSLSTARSWLRVQGLALVLPLACVMTGTAAQAQSASTFQNSCTHIGVDGGMLSADCRRSDGAYTPSSIPIPGIVNVDGVLQFNGTLGPSSFQNSCSQIAVEGDVLYAVCRGHGGMGNQTSIEIPGIVNIDGVLQYADAGGPPPGPDEEDSFVSDGASYGWYDDGWNGPGFYIAGYQHRHGYGFGGGEGWRGHHHMGGRPGFGGGGGHHNFGGHQDHEFRTGGQPNPNPFHPNNGFHPGAQPGPFHPNAFHRENGLNQQAHPGGQQPQFHQGGGSQQPQFHQFHQGGGQQPQFHQGGGFHPGGGAPGGGGHPGGGVHPGGAEKLPVHRQ
jgi:CVNH domain